MRRLHEATARGPSLIKEGVRKSGMRCVMPVAASQLPVPASRPGQTVMQYRKLCSSRYCP